MWRNRSQDQDSLSGTGRSGDETQSFADVRKIDLEVGEGYVIVQPDAGLEHEVEITVPEPEKAAVPFHRRTGSWSWNLPERSCSASLERRTRTGTDSWPSYAFPIIISSTR